MKGQSRKWSVKKLRREIAAGIISSSWNRVEFDVCPQHFPQCGTQACPPCAYPLASKLLYPSSHSAWWCPTRGVAFPDRWIRAPNLKRQIPSKTWWEAAGLHISATQQSRMHHKKQQGRGITWPYDEQTNAQGLVYRMTGLAICSHINDPN